VSLTKKHTVSEKLLASNRRNARLSHGPVTAEGRQRLRAANFRHGFYAKSEEISLRSLGEEPDQFKKLQEGLWKEFDPAGGLEEGLVMRLARAMWLQHRLDRMQEGNALRRAKDANIGRENRLHAQMMRLRMTAETLRLLVQAVTREWYITTRPDLEMMKSLHQEGAIGELGDIALALFYQLQAPGTDQDGVSREEQERRVLMRIKDIFGLNDPPAYAVQAGRQAPSPAAPESGGGTTAALDAPAAPVRPYLNITEQQWEARERARQLLENILTRQVESCETQRQTLRRESLAGPSPYELAAEVTPGVHEARCLRRLQNSYFREIHRVASLLLKLEYGESDEEPIE
jgi:hypothetical protein